MKNILAETTNIPANIKLTIHKTPKRIKLIRWIYEVLIDFDFSSFTYILTVSIIDNYLKENKLVDLQLLGISALFIAAKMEEKELKDISDYIEVTDNSYSQKEILDMEFKILESLRFNLNFVLPQHFFKKEWVRGSERKYVEVIFMCVCVILEKENGNMYYVMEKAKKMCDALIDEEECEIKEMKFYLDVNEKIHEIVRQIRTNSK